MPAEQKPKSGILICRVSTAEQAKKGTSLETQEAWGRRKADEMNVELVEVIKENASGERFLKENFDRILEVPEKKGVTHVFVYSLDRWSREVPYGCFLIEKLWENGVHFVTSAFIPDPSISSDRMQTFLSLIFSEMEHGGIHERTTRGIAAKLMRGEYFLPHLPFGCERVNMKIRLLSGFKQVIIFIFETFTHTESYAETARAINERYGKKMDFERKASEIKKIVTDRTYLGYLSWDGELFGEGDENKPREEIRVIDEETFEKAQAVVRKIGHKYSKNNLSSITPIENWVDEYGTTFALDHLKNLKVHCEKCDSSHLERNGKEVVNGCLVLKYKCCDCSHHFRFPSGTQLKELLSLNPIRCPICGVIDHFNLGENSLAGEQNFVCKECGCKFSIEIKKEDNCIPVDKNINLNKNKNRNKKRKKKTHQKILLYGL